MHLFNAFAATLLAGLAMAAPAATVPGTFNPSEVYIESVAYQGSGCHPTLGDTTVVISNDRQTLTVLYSNYVAASGAGIPITQSRSNCLLNIKVHTPRNYRFSVSQTTFHGWQDMGKACAGSVSASYWFSTQTGTVTGTANFQGGRNAPGNYEKTTNVLAIWPQCNVSTMININSQATIRCPAGDDGLLTVDSIDHTYKEVYAIAWQQC